MTVIDAQVHIWEEGAARHLVPFGKEAGIRGEVETMTDNEEE
jgi:hypothetical protein